MEKSLDAIKKNLLLLFGIQFFFSIFIFATAGEDAFERVTTSFAAAQVIYVATSGNDELCGGNY